MGTGCEGWTLTIVAGGAAMSAHAADVVAETIKAKPRAVITVPTGSTPLGMYDILAARAARSEIDFSSVEVFCLDEYVGVSADDPNSLTGWLWQAFLHRMAIAPHQIHPLPVTAGDLDAAAAEFERTLVARGGIDLAVLGLGPNGHIGYNEPGAAADSRTRIVTLTPESLAQASAYWEGAHPVPEQAMTMGVGTLLEARKIVLLVTGEAKADILRRTLEEPMSGEVPASWLRLAGPRLQIIADEAAVTALSLAPSH